MTRQLILFAAVLLVALLVAEGFKDQDFKVKRDNTLKSYAAACCARSCVVNVC